MLYVDVDQDYCPLFCVLSKLKTVRYFVKDKPRGTIRLRTCIMSMIPRHIGLISHRRCSIHSAPRASHYCPSLRTLYGTSLSIDRDTCMPKDYELYCQFSSIANIADTCISAKLNAYGHGFIENLSERVRFTMSFDITRFY